MKYSFEFAQRLWLAYEKVCKPLCQKWNIPQTAFDILMFLANNPEYHSARDIVEIRKIKANLVSVNVDKLVKEGYLVRKVQQEDRRKQYLFCTKKAAPIIEEGRKLQENFFENMMLGISPEQKDRFFQTFEKMNENLDMVFRLS